MMSEKEFTDMAAELRVAAVRRLSLPASVSRALKMWPKTLC